MSQASAVVLFVVLTGVASLGVWWLGYRRSRRDAKVLESVRRHEHKKAA